MAKELTLPIVVHLAAAAPAVLAGAIQIAAPKGTRLHRALGWLWIVAMAVLALSSFWIFEIRRGGGFSVIHLLSVLTLGSLVGAIVAIRRGNVKLHRNFMVGTLLGLAGAGAGALAPGRLVSQWVF